MRRLVALGVLTAVLVGTATAAPAFACVCGGVTPPPGETVEVTGERAILSLTEGVQQLDILFDLDSTTASTGLIIPTPTPATVTAGERERFDRLEAAMLPRASYYDDWWGFDAAFRAPATESATAPRVLDRVRIGDVVAVTLAASDAAGLTLWLGENGYALPDGSSALFAPYIADNWSFVAVKLVSEQQLTGTVDPVRLTFATDTMVLPLRMSARSVEPVAMRLYVLAEGRVDVTRAKAPGSAVNAAQRTIWAGELEGSLGEVAPYLTVTDLRFDDPEGQITDDLSVVPAVANDDIIPTVAIARPVELLGVPFGSLLVGWVVLGFLLVGGIIVGRTRTR